MKMKDFHVDFSSPDTYIPNSLPSTKDVLYATKNLLDTRNKLGIYHALVSSHLNYGISVWGDSKTSYIKKIETVGRRRNKYELKSEGVN